MEANAYIVICFVNWVSLYAKKISAIFFIFYLVDKKIKNDIFYHKR